jgi:hypothetical protein
MILDLTNKSLKLNVFDCSLVDIIIVDVLKDGGVYLSAASDCVERFNCAVADVLLGYQKRIILTPSDCSCLSSILADWFKIPDAQKNPKLFVDVHMLYDSLDLLSRYVK